MEQLLENLSASIGISDVIDIILVTFLFYKLLGFIRETRAEQLAKGIILLIVLTMISNWAHFYALHWILSGILSVGLVAVVVIFQPEFRRLLENIGQSKVYRIFDKIDVKDAKEVIDQIIVAIEDMSKTKTGALMVFERESMLNEIADTGTAIDAKLSSELVRNIFYEGSPLHDGAMIVRNGRIHAAGCVLPLTESKQLSKDLGTRHRAGIGISENSDALVLIVSEETGIVSKAEAGKIQRPLDTFEINRILVDLYMPEQDKKPLFFSKKTFKGGAKDE